MTGEERRRAREWRGSPRGREGAKGPKHRKSVGARVKGGGPRRVGRPKFRAFFSFSRSHFQTFFLSLEVFSWNFGGVLPEGENKHI